MRSEIGLGVYFAHEKRGRHKTLQSKDEYGKHVTHTLFLDSQGRRGQQKEVDVYVFDQNVSVSILIKRSTRPKTAKTMSGCWIQCGML